jgi:hypothetical protein
MTIRIDLDGLRRTKWHEYAIRFVFGGLITAAAGLIAQRYGPVVGGLFLPFPRSFRRAQRSWKNTKRRKRSPPACEALSAGAKRRRLMPGAALGAVGLTAFAVMVWQFISVTYSRHCSPLRDRCCGWEFPDSVGEFAGLCSASSGRLAAISRTLSFGA